MRKEFDSIHYLNAKNSKNQLLIYVPIDKTVISYHIDYGKLVKQTEFVYPDDILNFHPLNNNQLIIIGKSNKLVSTYNQQGEKLHD